MKVVNVGLIKISHYIGSSEHNMALPDLDRLTGESFLFGHSSGIYSGCTCCSFSVFFQYIIITNLLGPTVTFPGSRAQSGKFGGFGGISDWTVSRI